MRHLVQFAQEERMGLVKTGRLAAMQKQQRAKAMNSAWHGQQV